nr:NADH dehydrogenase I, G subunit (75 kDa) [uncultured bacterium]
MPVVTIDGKQIEVEKGTTIIKAAEKLGISIPRYCYHPGLSVAGNCRICMVEVEKTPKLQISCHIQCQDGMVIHTQSEKVKKAREHVLEFLLVNHPLDCPVCDQAGECKLQDYYMEHGLYNSRVDENKVKKSAKAQPIGPTIVLDSERCILCSRCVRFCDEVTHTGEFGIFNRGDHSEIGLYPGKELNNKYSGNVADICPVGALTDRDFRFKCRVWYLRVTESVCPGCARGCNTTVEWNSDRRHKAGPDRVMRLKPRFNDDVNDWWLCDEGRYGYKPIDQNRVTRVLKRTDVQQESHWGVLNEVGKKLTEAVKQKDSVVVILSPDMTNEELYAAQKLFSGDLELPNVFLVRMRPDGYQDQLLIRADKHPNRKGAEFIGYIESDEQKKKLSDLVASNKVKALIVFGHDLYQTFEGASLEALKRIPLKISIATNQNRFTDISDFVLPAAVYAETEGTFTNFEGRVQRIKQALTPLADAKSTLEILSLMAREMGFQWPEKKPEQWFLELAAEVPSFSNMNYDTLASTGIKAERKR